ncbi:DUF4044 domain-containing protein [Streptococcus dentapri]|uniref:DUF4044 domain-containing protein n=1 Tax=Streptococcus dentapri TaxID=573564 RepID=A0ABV8D3L2_9STRE
MVFGDNGPRKKTGFEHLTKFVVVAMVVIVLFGLLASAISVLF